VQNKAKETPETGNDLVTELLLQYAFLCIFTSGAGSKVMQYNTVNQHIAFIFVFLIKQVLLSAGLLPPLLQTELAISTKL